MQRNRDWYLFWEKYIFYKVNRMKALFAIQRTYKFNMSTFKCASYKPETLKNLTFHFLNAERCIYAILL